MGLHIHVPEGAYRPAQILKFQVHAKEPIRSLTIAFVGEPPTAVKPRRPTRHLKLKLRVPEGIHGETTGLQAEGTTDQGTVVRAAAVVRLAHGD